MGCVLWIIDINPYSKQLQVYNQSCEDMILDNSYCNGKWVDDPVISYLIDSEQSTVIKSEAGQSNTSTYNNCSISDRKNWSCINNETNEGVFSVNGEVKYNEETETPKKIGKRTITRLKWIQNRFLDKLSSS